MLTSNSEHLDQIGCHIFIAVFLEKSVVAQGIFGGTSVWHKTFLGIHSANYCNTRGIVVKSKMSV
jgi:hypothetical protein